jgi:CPA2 family monovalent cation:H+ antiporter-2
VSIHDFLRDAVAVLAASILVVLVSHRLRIPAVVGFLLTGILIGPSALGLVADTAQVEVFAEIGVVFLLFTIGLEFSLNRLSQVRRAFFLGGSLQSLLTVALGALVFLALPLGVTLPQAVFFGFLLALSSTAIVLKLYADRRELDAPQGKLVIGILLFQDFLIVPMIVLTPVLAGVVEASALAILGRFLAALALVGAVFAAARYLMPRLLHLLVRTRLREVLVLGSLLICLGMAWLTESLELSLALGAFLAGIVISESEYSHQVVAEVTPFRDVFNSVFFISVGMLLDLPFALAHPLWVSGLTLLVLVAKTAAAGAAVALLGFPVRIVALVALGLAQVGEFSFVLLRVGQRHGLLAPDLYQSFLAASVVSMMLTPLLIALAPRWGEWLAARRGRPVARATGGEEPAGRRPQVVIVGFGVNGKNLARVLHQAEIPYRVVELSPEGVRQAREAGEPVVFGDATRPEILEHAGVAGALVAVFGISDLAAVRRGIRLARGLNPCAPVWWRRSTTCAVAAPTR